MLKVYCLSSCCVYQTDRYFIKLAVWKILPATNSNGKQNILFQNKIDLQQCRYEQSSRHQTSHYKLLLSQFWPEELAISPSERGMLAPQFMARPVTELWHLTAHISAHKLYHATSDIENNDITNYNQRLSTILAIIQQTSQ